MQKRVSRWLLLLVAGVMALTVSASATTVVGSAGAGWQVWSAPDQDGTPYWDNTSQDGNKKNIGYFLSKTGGFSSHPSSPNITPDWWGYNGGGADLNFHFSSPLSQHVALVIEVAGFANINELGWYDVANPTVGGVIFPGPAGAGSSTVFSPTPNFGLYIKTSGGVKYYTQSLLNPAAERQHQHFALFKEAPGVYWIGVEDKPANTGEGFGGDYNDMVIRMAVVPEPTTMGLFALGLLPLLRRRKA
ncbi:MAG: PEP-CTERM sorting domain-containing protein [Chthonomonadetes bacterium]|nr:PEP-CTERM sorting domain-containing protein [Chthonomonadetes bacterium]